MLPAVVNDVHSKLNATRVAGIVTPRSLEELRGAVLASAAAGRAVSICGGRHAMGGQQFGAGTTLIDTRRLNRVLALDRHRGLLTVEGGIQWPELLGYLAAAQRGRPHRWGIYQKQTGADRLTLAGALACNAHGRGLTLPPIAAQVESFDLMTVSGELRRCSRAEHPDLFALAIGGYGLFGIVTSVTLRLRPRVKLRRVVEVVDAEGLMARFARRIASGFEYGDFQFAIDPRDDTFLRRGVFACYEPVPLGTPLTEHPAGLSAGDWRSLILDAHRDKRAAFDRYAELYRRTSGQVYWSDDQLSGAYLDDYHADVDRALGGPVRGSEMITELYAPRGRFDEFMAALRRSLRESRADVIYGTVRLIERDTDTFLAWARQPWACVVLNLHVDHTPAAIAAAGDAFRALIDVAIDHGGSYYLTYHRWARRDQAERCHPRLRAFLDEKARRDPSGLFQSDWYRRHREMLV